MPKISGLVSPREKEIARRVGQVREHINWPQPAFAAELNISRDRLASVEYSRTPLRFADGYRLCMVFDINPEWLANGVGEMRSTLLTPNLPLPEGFPAKAMFSRIYDQYTSGKPAPPVKKGTRLARQMELEQEMIPNFDATAHVVRGLTDLLTKEKFESALVRQEFALEITTYARELALRLRRDATKDRTRPVAGRRGGPPPKQIDLAGIPAKNAKLVLRLRDGIHRLDREIGKLDAAMKTLNPIAINSSSLPRPAAFEVSRLEEAIEKIARQIEEAEAKMKALMAKRNSGTD
jgi:transcriptional regulator with XRE-family HTH domain